MKQTFGLETGTCRPGHWWWSIAKVHAGHLLGPGLMIESDGLQALESVQALVTEWVVENRDVVWPNSFIF